VGTPREYLEANWDALEGRLDGAPAREHRRVRRGRICTVARGATLEAPVLLGDGVEISRGARIGPLTCIGNGARIGAGAVLARSVVWPGVHLGEGVELESSIVAPHCTVKP
jgi:NDP-sugar pyrophosphorylase family protein